MAGSDGKTGQEMAKEVMKNPKLILGYKEPLPGEVMDCIWHYPFKFSFLCGNEEFSEETRGILKHRLIEKIEYGYLDSPGMLAEEALADPQIRETALESRPEVFKELKDPTREEKIYAAGNMQGALMVIKDPDTEIEIAAMRHDPHALRDVYAIEGKIPEAVRDEVMENPLDYAWALDDETFSGEVSFVEKLEEEIDRTCGQMEEAGLTYSDENVCVVCVNEDTDIEKSPDGTVRIGFADPKMQKNLEKIAPEDKDGKKAPFYGKAKEKKAVFFIEKVSEDSINVYAGNGKMKDGVYHAETAGEDLFPDEAVGIVERSMPSGNMEDIEKKTQMHAEVMDRIEGSCCQKDVSRE